MSRGAKTLPNESETLQLNDPNCTTTNSLDLLVLKALKNGHKTLQPTYESYFYNVKSSLFSTLFYNRLTFLIRELTFHGPRSLIMFETSRFARSIAVNANGTYSVNGGSTFAQIVDSLFGYNIWHLIVGESMGPWSQSMENSFARPLKNRCTSVQAVTNTTGLLTFRLKLLPHLLYSST
jgi:hypothetical protein